MGVPQQTLSPCCLSARIRAGTARSDRSFLLSRQTLVVHSRLSTVARTGLRPQGRVTGASEPRARLRAGGATARSRRSFQRRRKRSAPAKRQASERVGESEGRQPLGKNGGPHGGH